MSKYQGDRNDSTSSLSSVDIIEDALLPNYCYHFKFFLIEELALEEDYRELHYGNCCVIGKLHDKEGNFELENIKIANFPIEYSLPEGTLAIRLLIFDYFGTELQSGHFCQVYGEVVLIDTCNPSANHIPLTVRGIHERLLQLHGDQHVEQQLLAQIQQTHKVAIKLLHLSEIDRADELIERNLQIRLLQNRNEQIGWNQTTKVMTQHFIESIAAAQPQLYVFEQQFTCSDNPQDYEKVLNDFEHNFELLQQQDWLKYWQINGEELILQRWKLKYKNYLVDDGSADAGETVTEKLEEIIEDNLSEDVVKITDEIEELTDESFNDYSESWLELWQQHSEEIYAEQYILYTSIYYNFYLNFKNLIQTNSEDNSGSDLESDVSIESQCKEEESEAVHALELEQLKLLGLPTAFGGRSSTAKRSQKGGKRTKSIESHSELYSIFFSSSDEEEVDKNEDEEVEEEEEALNKIDFDEIEKGNKMAPIHPDSQKEVVSSPAALHELQNKTISKNNKKRRNRNKKQQNNINRKLRNIPDFILSEKNCLMKYWRKRFSLFSRYDEGIRLDRESWFSVTPEKVAEHLAKRLPCDIIVDGFCGCGGNAIQFARHCRRVIAIDIDPMKIEMAKHNATIYGVAEKIDFIVGDFLQLSDSGQLKGDIVFLSPPWGGPKYKNKESYDIEKCLEPIGAAPLLAKVRKISPNIGLFLPRNSNMKQIIKLAGVGNTCEILHSFLDSRLIAITALFGDTVISKDKVVT